MPESPEINFYYNTYFKKLSNKSFTELSILSGKYKRKEPANYLSFSKQLPLNIVKTGVKGKNIWILFDNDTALYFTHGMTGYWTNVDEKHNHIKLVINNNTLYFNDMRGFGTMSIMTKLELDNKLNTLGVDVMTLSNNKNDKQIVMNAIFTKKNSNKIIGKILMEQNILSGIGNYLRAEILWDAIISPYRLLKDFSEDDKDRLFTSIINVVQYHYNNILKYKHAHYPSRKDTFKVYMQKKDINDMEVTHDKLDSRTIHWVKGRQI